MPEIFPSPTTTTTLTAVLDRLRTRTAVDGLILIGSLAAEMLNPASDYDIVIVLAERPAPLHVGVTNIDGRVTDLVFCTADQVDAILGAHEPAPFETWTGRLMGWLEAGRIVFDRNGNLAAAQQKVRTGAWIQDSGRTAHTNAWSRINYNLQVVRRYLDSDDPRYLEAADLRMMLYGPADLFFGYFTIRGLRWGGEKEALAHLETHDPAYLALFQRFLAEAARDQKARLYAELAAQTVAPVGDVWGDESTVMLLEGSDVDSEMERQALAFWLQLVGGQ